ncbi:hypothetical protein GQX74_005740 [Glossina fuscipes]|nr:hypothetical protein GQX74_005740 [Glossina fuscipes]
MAGYFNILQLVAAICYPLAVSFGAEALVSLRRMQAFLQQDDCEDRTRTYKMDRMSSRTNVKAVVIQEASAKWDASKVKLTLDKIELSIPVVPVEFYYATYTGRITGGGVVINGAISYAAQEPWLFSGECGASLSGGQRARISLARAIYKRASIYLLYDLLNAVDTHVGRHRFEEVIGPRSCLAQQNITRILITHQVHFLNEADWIVIIENGRLSRQGTYKELIISELDFAKLLERPQRENSKSESTTSNSEEYSNKEEEDIPYIDGENASAELTDKIALVGLSFMVFVMLLSQIV